jgi:predicted RNA-binding protein YlxR (DUF448 family)
MPIRTCAGCQAKDVKQNLVRAVAEGSGRINIDEHATMPGRGVWIHRRRKCLEAAAAGGFARSLRRRTQHVDVERLWELVQDEVSRA